MVAIVSEATSISLTIMLGAGVVAVALYYFCGSILSLFTLSKPNNKVDDSSKPSSSSKEDNITKDKETDKSRAVHWGYGKENGPSRWYDLNPEKYFLCKDGNGHKQSPINIDSSRVLTSKNSKDNKDNKHNDSKTVQLYCDEFAVHYPSIKNGFLINNGLTIMVHSNNDFNFDKGSNYTEDNPSHHKHHIMGSNLFDAAKQMSLASVSMEYDGYIVLDNTNKYYLEQFHFHSPSEHCINGKYYDLELHFVHKSDKNELAVLGILFDLIDSKKDSKKDGSNKEEHSFLKQFWSHLPSKEDINKEYFFEKNLNNLVIDMKLIENEIVNNKLLCYHGSLTTPPCSEGVKWFVLNKVQYITKDELDRFKRCMNGINNSRPIQSMYNRVVTECDNIQCC